MRNPYFVSRLPSVFISAFNQIMTVLDKLLPYANICLGDYDSKTISTDANLKSAGCLNVPLKAGFYSVFSIDFTSLLCPSPTKVSICLIFDNQGTYGVAFNVGLPMCVGESITSMFGSSLIAVATSQITNNSFIVFSYSQKSNLIVNATIPVMKNNEIEEINFNIPGNFYFNSGIAIGDILSSYEIDDLTTFITIKGSITVLSQQIQNTSIDKLVATLNQVPPSEARQSLLMSSGYIFVNLSGFIQIRLSLLTSNKIPDMSFNLNQSLMITKKGSNIEKGFYFINLTPDSINDAYENINGFINSYSKVFQYLNIPKPEFKESKFQYGGFITDTAIGVYIKLSKTIIKCTYLRIANELSCRFNSEIITFIEKNQSFWLLKSISSLIRSES